MSLSVDGVWKAGVWATTVWADGVWREGDAPPPVETTTQTPAGSSNRRKQKRRQYVEIDGQSFPVDSAEQAKQLLERARALAEKHVETQEKVVAKADKPERISIPAIEVSREIKAEVSPLIADIERLYKKAAERARMNEELRELLAKKLRDEDDEDDEFLLLS